jgi:hypothetical protein
MLTITHDKDGRVMRVGYRDATLPKGAIEVAEIPQEPTLEEGKACELWWTGTALEWRIYDAPPPPEPEPIPEPEEPKPPTNEEISQMRQEAYVAECDPYLVAYQGYLVEGDTAKAESARLAYLKAKAEVRKRLPYGEGD